MTGAQESGFPSCVIALSQAFYPRLETLTDRQQWQLRRLLIMLRNNSRKGLELAERYANGELSLEHILELMDR